jgi:hypothetical protein
VVPHAAGASAVVSTSATLPDIAALAFPGTTAILILLDIYCVDIYIIGR